MLFVQQFKKPVTMDQKNKNKNCVTFSKENKLVYSSESEPPTEEYSINPTSTNLSMSKLSIGDTGSNCSITGSVMEEVEDFKLKLRNLETKCKVLEQENDKVFTELCDEKKRNDKLQKKLTFVKDNQEVFMKLKEAYINMKYNEAAGRKMIEIREKGMQTWEGILCKGCIDAEEIRRNAEQIRDKYINSFLISPENMQQLETTVRYLKDLTERREQSWSLNMEREIKLQTHIQALTNENEDLKDLIKSNHYDDSLGGAQSGSKKNGELKKIIVKFERRFRDMSEKSGRDKKFSSPLNQKEQVLVQHLMSKYTPRMREKSRSYDRLKCQSVSADRLSRHSSEDSVIRHKINIENTVSKGLKSENAILMLDSLFTSDSNSDIHVR